MTVPVYPSTREGLTAALAALGGSGDVVATTLRMGGWRGTRGSCVRCPVARYLAEQFPGCEVDVDYDRGASLAHRSGGSWTALACVDLPEPVENFARRFDRGRRYDDLLEDGPVST